MARETTIPIHTRSKAAIVQAAVRGEGVVLGRKALIVDDLAADRLVRPFDLSLPAGFAYYVVCPLTPCSDPT